MIFDRASRTPESSEELVEMINFIDSARHVELVQLTDSVKVRAFIGDNQGPIKVDVIDAAASGPFPK